MLRFVWLFCMTAVPLQKQHRTLKTPYKVHPGTGQHSTKREAAHTIAIPNRLTP